MSHSSRREFIQRSLLTAFALGTLSLRSAPARAADAAKPPLVAESDPVAKALGYHVDANKVDTKKWTKRAGPDGKSQHCSNCLLFNSGKVTTDATGPCSLFPGKHVAAKAWCNSWTKNPGAK